MLGPTLTYGQCTTSVAGSYVGGEITISPVMLGPTLMYGQRITSVAGPYAGGEITI